MREWGLHISAQGCRYRSTPSRRVEDVPTSLQDSKGMTQRDIILVHSRTTHKAATSCSLTLSRANLALTLTKLVLRTKNLITAHLDGSEVFFNVYGVSLNSSNSKMTGGSHIYRPPGRASRL